jgi:hypothetical protein
MEAPGADARWGLTNGRESEMSNRIEKQRADFETGSPAGSTIPIGREGTWVRPCEVLATSADGVRVEVEGKQLFASLALAVPYEPVVGDQLLLLGDGRSAWVVGVIRGNGKTRLALEGDVDVSASGELTLRGGRGVSVEGPRVRISSSRLELLASRVTEVYDSVRTTVRELMSVRAGEQHTLVEKTSHLQAKNARVLSEEKVTINGKEIFLG